MTSRSPRVIDFQEGLTPQMGSWVNTRQQVVQELQEHGCFMARYEQLKGNQSNLFEASKKIFDRLHQTNPDMLDFAYEQRGQYESFDIPRATTLEGTQNFITRMWRGGKDDIRNAILGYTRTAEVLEKMVRQMVFEQYGLPEESTGYIFQMMKYERELGLDFAGREENFLAVLDLNQQVNDLEMTTNDGRRFSINVRPSTFLIMARRPLTAWGNVSILHGNEEKYAVVLFSY